MATPAKLQLILDAEQKWQAIERRDTRYDGMFVFAVHSTGIYCRPSCPSRRPRRDRVAFYDDAAAAGRDGYRACLRCRPTLDPAAASGAELVQRACRLIEEADAARVSVDALCAKLGVSPSHLQRSFKKHLGVTPRQYAAANRLERFKHRIKEGDSVVDSIYEAGYGSSSRLYENAAAQLGMTPAVYRRGGQGMKIVYTVVETPLGKLLVAATERGVCSVAFGEKESLLAEALGAEYPAAEISREADPLRGWVSAILAHLDGRSPQLDLPLDVQATAFQQRVWSELRRIPYGETRSYAELAESIGRPTATRAVARACATNPVALVNPCHRIVRADGEPGGYRWGVERKQRLLAQEQKERT